MSLECNIYFLALLNRISLLSSSSLFSRCFYSPQFVHRQLWPNISFSADRDQSGDIISDVWLQTVVRFFLIVSGYIYFHIVMTVIRVTKRYFYYQDSQSASRPFAILLSSLGCLIVCKCRYTVLAICFSVCHHIVFGYFNLSCPFIDCSLPITRLFLW